MDLGFHIRVISWRTLRRGSSVLGAGQEQGCDCFCSLAGPLRQGASAASAMSCEVSDCMSVSLSRPSLPPSRPPTCPPARLLVRSLAQVLARSLARSRSLSLCLCLSLSVCLSISLSLSLTLSLFLSKHMIYI